MKHHTRSNCRKEPTKIVPTITEVEVCDIPENFPKTCEKMIGNTYPAIVHTDNRGKTWYKILKDLVFGQPKEEEFDFKLAFQTTASNQNPDKVSFTNRKYITLHEQYCN